MSAPTATRDFNFVSPRVETFEVWKAEDGRWRVHAWDNQDEPVHDTVTGRSFPSMGAARSAAQYAWPKAIEVFL
jgi:hypothetical protein